MHGVRDERDMERARNEKLMANAESDRAAIKSLSAHVDELRQAISAKDEKLAAAASEKTKLQDRI
jgi:hypothetical protein